MKINNLVCIFLIIASYCKSQVPGEWVWMHGDSTGSSLGNFGVQGVPSPNNVPPGLYEACEWTDLNGNFWLFGGIGGLDYGALWKYDPLTNEWTWMSGSNVPNFPGSTGTMGIPSQNNLPKAGGLGRATWTDADNNLWFYDNSFNNELWKYNIATNEWTWMQGWGSNIVYGTKGVPDTANTPGSRIEIGSSWFNGNSFNAEQNLWFFGGSGIGMMNDLWKFNIQTNSWTWMKGSQLGNQSAVYGTLGVEDSTNTPSGRWVYTKWKDKNGNFWTFGGTDGLGQKNDLWRYNPSTNNWTWMSGSTGINSLGNYGTKCVIAPTNIPRARYENRAAWTDSKGNFWMYGGISFGVSNANLNDLWVYCTDVNQWIWVSNDSTVVNTCNWGTKGVSSPANKPGARWGALSWYDNNGHLYLFGGLGSYTGASSNNDLWKYTIDTTCYCPSTLSVKNLISDNKISIYPNPIKNTFNIIVEKNIKDGVINIFNEVGVNVFSCPFNGTEKTIEVELSQGIYFIKLTDGNNILTSKLIIAN